MVVFEALALKDAAQKVFFFAAVVINPLDFLG